ncbi:MAG: HAD family hydrolase [Alphaproteobacteria bacterium]|jgi:putative hydrolase of the HAD superfamily|nr:HAD family hydrolase [Alphaproteobacteria bacterium]
MVEIKFPEVSLLGKKAVFLDIDDTLYSYKDAHNIALDVCASYFPNMPNFKEEYRSYRNKITERLQPQGSCRSRLLAFMEMFEYLKIDNPYTQALYYDELYWNTLIDNISLATDAAKFINECREKNISIIITTDMLTWVQIKKLQKLNILDKITSMITSEQVGCEKSHPQFFQFVLNKYNLDVKDVLCIGDDKTKDYNIPTSLGITSYLVQHVVI